MRFSLLTLLLLSVFAAVAMGALTQPHWIGSSVLSAVVLLSLGVAGVLTWSAEPGRGKQFATGYAMIGGLYLILGAPQSPWLGRDLPTNALIRWMDRPTELNPIDEYVLEALQLQQQAASPWFTSWSPQPPYAAPETSLRLRIGHWLWTILFALAGGLAASRRRGSGDAKPLGQRQTSADDTQAEAGNRGETGNRADLSETGDPPAHGNRDRTSNEQVETTV